MTPRSWLLAGVTALISPTVACGQSFSAGPSDASSDTAVSMDVTTGTPPPADAPFEAASGPGFCASLKTNPFFCDDFDERGTSDVTGAWTAAYASDAGVSLALSKAESVSPPQSLLAMTDVTLTGGAGLLKSLGNVSSATLTFEVKIDRYGAGSASAASAVLAAFTLGSEGTTQVGLVTTGPQAWALALLVKNTGSGPAPFSVPYTLSGWGHLSFHAELIGEPMSNVKVTLTDDDTAQLLGATTFSLTLCPDCPLTTAVIGLVASQGDWSAYFDNVLVSDVFVTETDD